MKNKSLPGIEATRSSTAYGEDSSSIMSRKPRTQEIQIMASILVSTRLRRLVLGAINEFIKIETSFGIPIKTSFI